MQHRRWGGEKFYEHARPPPPAKQRKFMFTVYQRVEAGSDVYEPIVVEIGGVVTFEEALAELTAKFPGHHVAEHLKGLWEEVT